MKHVFAALMASTLVIGATIPAGAQKSIQGTGEIGTGTLSFAAKPIVIAGQTHSDSYVVEVKAWGGPGQEIAKSGTISLALKNDKGIVLEKNVSGSYESATTEHIVMAQGKNYLMLFSYGADLQEVGGLEGVIQVLKNLGLNVEAPNSVAKDYNAVLVLINSKGEVELVDTLVASKNLR